MGIRPGAVPFPDPEPRVFRSLHPLGESFSETRKPLRVSRVRREIEDLAGVHMEVVELLAGGTNLSLQEKAGAGVGVPRSQHLRGPSFERVVSELDIGPESADVFVAVGAQRSLGEIAVAFQKRLLAEHDVGGSLSLSPCNTFANDLP